MGGEEERPVKKNILMQLEELAQKICDEYCRFPRECECEDELIEGHCESCPIVEMLT